MRIYYSIHGVTVCVSATDEPIQRLIRSRLSAFAVPSPEGSADLTFDFETRSIEKEPPHLSGVEVYTLPRAEIRYSSSEDRLRIVHPDLEVESEPGAERFVFFLRSLSDRTRWLATHGFFTVPLLEGLRRRGLYSLHAAAVASGSSAVLIAGPSGAGKSTLTVALLRRGCDFLGDDTVFLATDVEGRLVVRGFPDEVDLTSASLAHWPDLGPRARRQSAGASTKAQLVVPEALPHVRVSLAGRPVALVLSSIDESATESSLVELDPDSALEELDATIAQTHRYFVGLHRTAYESLVRACPSYRLRIAGDPDRAAQMLMTHVDIARAQGRTDAP